MLKRGSGLMLLVAGSALFVQYAYRVTPPPPLNAPLTMTLALLAIIPLAWRRLFLIAGLAVVTAAFIAFETTSIARSVNLSSIASMLAVVSSAAYGGLRRDVACVSSIVAFNGALLYTTVFSGGIVFTGVATLLNFTGLLWTLATFLATWSFGNTLRVSRGRTLSLMESGAVLALGLREKAGPATVEAGVRIARQMYHTLGRGVSSSFQVLGRAKTQTRKEKHRENHPVQG
jgi:hypothetical protein